MRKFPSLFFASIFIVVLLFMWYGQSLSPANTHNTTQTTFVISPGEGLRAVAKNLKKNNLIKNDIAFTIMVFVSGLDKKIQAGDFRLSPSESSRQIAQDLTKGTLDIWVTIPEGKRAEEIAAIFKTKLSNYDLSWNQQLNQHEGYLFPDTYLIPHDADIQAIITMMTDNFSKKYAQVTNSTSMSQNQIVILASLIEREANTKEDRPLISSVLHNRLDLGMPLQVDATVQYALGYDTTQKTWWRKNLSLDELHTPSDYNTYVNPGLPSGPICNPGLAALQAAANPAKTNYLYYITDKNGINHYASTLDQHNANIKKYGL
ncbi:MAG TPA: endolytic transglycosylase MltG [Patescibacteria group bacterium]|nr:endolytic transglycosylase MltG [Patescibacteria group bacterium]